VQCSFNDLAERVTMLKGRFDRKKSTATAYAWIVWQRGRPGPRLALIPPCRKLLERDRDYGRPRIERCMEKPFAKSTLRPQQNQQVLSADAL
jgi:hypothetical protein